MISIYSQPFVRLYGELLNKWDLGNERTKFDVIPLGKEEEMQT